MKRLVGILGGVAASLLVAGCARSDSAVDFEVRASGQVWLDGALASSLARIEVLRGVRFPGPVRADWVPAGGFDSLVDHLSAQVDFPPDPAWEYSERTLLALGMVDSLGQWAKARKTFDQGTILGFYLPATRTLYVFDNPDREELGHVVVHELVHALQDQRFRLDRMSASTREQDEDRALELLVEGEAEYVAMQSALDDPPPAVLDSMILSRRGSLEDLANQLDAWARPQGIPLSMALPDYLPYVFGSDFISGVRSRGGWGAVDSSFRSPPSTSRLPLFRLADDGYVDWNPGGCPAVSGAWRPIQTGRVGASLLAALAYPGRSRNGRFDSLVSSWRGDRFWSFESRSVPGLLWRLRTADSASARDLSEALWAARFALARSASWVIRDTARAERRVARDSSGDRSLVVVARGSDVVVVEGFSVSESDSLCQALLSLPEREAAAAGRAARMEAVFGAGSWSPPRRPFGRPPPIPGMPR
ncbi:MAG: hypothetical protein H6686_11845 [Fibrobacteria bacterium]|nr:hypothetical protein [Fibrobacteria bacterium]